MSRLWINVKPHNFKHICCYRIGGLWQQTLTAVRITPWLRRRSSFPCVQKWTKMESNFLWSRISLFNLNVFGEMSFIYHLRVPILDFVFVKTNVDRMLNSTSKRVWWWNMLSHLLTVLCSLVSSWKCSHNLKIVKKL